MKKVLTLMCFIIIIATSVQYLYADEMAWWTKAGDFFSGATDNTDMTAIKDLENIIVIAGNMVFFAVTVILGVKYIWGSVESKASIKESLITLVVAAIFFYGYTTIKSLFVGTSGLTFVKDDFEGSAKSVYSLIIYISNYFAIGGIIYVGIRYMMAGASGKAELKAKSIPLVLGIVMVYATLTFLTFITGIFN